MKSHLRYISKEYEQLENEQGVAPISQTDCEIITELGQIAFLKGEEKLSNIIENWKKNPDDKTLDKLIEYGNSVDPDQHNDGLMGMFKKAAGPKEVITIQDQDFTVYLIYSIKRCVYEEGYALIINPGPMPAKSCWYEDTVFKFKTEDHRDREYNRIRNKLVELNIIKFI